MAPPALLTNVVVPLLPPVPLCDLDDLGAVKVLLAPSTSGADSVLDRERLQVGSYDDVHVLEAVTVPTYVSALTILLAALMMHLAVSCDGVHVPKVEAEPLDPGRISASLALVLAAQPCDRGVQGAAKVPQEILRIVFSLEV